MRSFFILRECEQQMMSAACVESACSSLGCSFPPRKKCDKQKERKTCLGMCWDCERVCSQVSPWDLVPQFRRFGLQRLGWIVSKRLSQKRACFNFTFFCGIDELPNVQVLCCVKELLEQFVLELRLDGKQSYHLLMHPFIRHSIAHGCQLRFYEPPLSPCNNLFFPA
jgi:hypothetical protein